MAGKEICWFRAVLTKRFKGISPPEILRQGAFPFRSLDKAPKC